MQKGKFGFSLWLYPYIALWSLFVWETGAMLICLALTLFAIAIEKDEWCTKQCLKIVMFSVYWGMYNVVMASAQQIPLAGYAFMVIDFIISVIVFIIVFIFGMMRIMKGADINIPGKGTVNRAYGFVQQYVQAPPTQQSYQAPPQQQSYQQPVPPTQAPPAPPAGFTPPPAPPAGFTAPAAPPSSFTPPPAPPQN